MKNSYQNDIQTVQLGNIISSVGSLLDRSESMQETLSMFHLEQSAEILLQLLEAGGRAGQDGNTDGLVSG